MTRYTSSDIFVFLLFRALRNMQDVFCFCFNVVAAALWAHNDEIHNCDQADMSP